MGKLAGSLCYLGGAIDRVPDGGEIWRANFTSILERFGVYALNPLIKPIEGHIEDTATRKLRTAAQLLGNFEFVLAEKSVRDIDLQMVHLSNFLLVYLDMDERPFGTIEEMVVANQDQKPIIVLSKQGRKVCPQWLIWMLGSMETIFDSEEEVIAYLCRIDSGEIVNKKFIFLNLARKLVSEPATLIS